MSKKTERDRLIEEISYLNTRRGFDPERLFEAYKRLNKINICQNIYEMCPKTMDPIKVQKHWEKSYVALLALKPQKRTLEGLKKINDQIMQAHEKRSLENVYSYRELMKKVIIEMLASDQSRPKKRKKEEGSGQNSQS